MIRSRLSEAEKPAHSRESKRPHTPVILNEARSEIETLAAEHRSLVFWLVQEARKNGALTVNRLLVLLVAESVLLAGLALTSRNVFGGSGLTSLVLHLAFVLGAGGASVLLSASMAFALYGAAFIWGASPGSTLPGELLPRQRLLNLALADLARLRQAQQRSSRLFRRAALLFLIALLPYLLAVAVLILQVL